jgi:DNA polymerase I
VKICFGDLEANGLLDTATKAHCGVFKNMNTKKLTKFRPNQIPEMLKWLDTVDVLIMHNGIGYDWPLLKKLYGYTYKGKKVDTLVMSRLLDPKRIIPFNCPNKTCGPHSVEAWGYRVGRGKPQHDDWEVFSEAMLHRCTEDVEILELIYEALQKEQKASGGKWRDAFLLSFELFENLQKQEEYGWLVDKAHMEACIHQLTRWMDKIDKVITPYLPLIVEVEETKKDGEFNYVRKPFLKSGKYSESVSSWYARTNLSPDAQPVAGSFSRISFRRTDLNSNLETKDFLLSLGWEPLEWNTNDDGERTSPKLSKDDPFEGLDSKIGRLVAKRVQCRQRRGIIEGLLELVRPDGRIGSAVNTLAVTGRATHRNIVNIPKAGSFYGKQMRRIFTSSPGKVLVGTDSDGCQLRMLAGRMRNPVYTQALLKGDKKLGTDNHSLTMKAADLESRDVAKNVMYCLMFGGQDAKLGKTAKKVGKGAEIRQALYKGLDGLEELIENLKKEWRKTARQRYNPKYNRMEYFDGTITGLDGRPIKVPYEYQVLVYLLQSDESIMMTKAYNLLWERLSAKYEFGKDFGVVIWMHDEYEIECREEIAEDVKLISEQCIADAGKFFNIQCPHEGQGKIGKDWYSVH